MHRSSSFSLALVTIGYITGVGATELVSASVHFLLMLMLLSSILFFRALTVSGSRRIILATSVLALSAFVAGSARLHFASENYHITQHVLSPCIESPCRFEGVVTEDVVSTVSESTATLRIEKINDRDVSKKVYIQLTQVVGSPIRFGDKILFENKIRIPQSFVDTQSHRTIHYEQLMRARGVHGQAYLPKVQIVEHATRVSLREGLFAIRSRFVGSLQKNIHEPAAALGIGITVGGAGSLPEETQEQFRRTGLSHVVVLSGYNIAVLLSVLGVLFVSLRTSMKVTLLTLSILAFITMTGLTAPAVRAGSMGLLLLYAKALHRERNALHALTIAVLGMGLYNPFSLFEDVSFQLSVLATIGVLLGTEYFSAHLQRLPEIFRETLSATVSATIAVLPILLYNFGSLSVVSLFANLLVLPTIPYAMLATLLVGVVGMLSDVLVFPFSFAAQFILDFDLACVAHMSSVPWAAISVSYFPLWACCVSYIFVARYFVYMYRSNKK